jgi:hypothetical protein
LLIGHGKLGTGLEKPEHQVITAGAKTVFNCKVATDLGSEFWPEHKYCKVTKVDLSKKSKLTFKVTPDERIEEISTVQFWFGRDIYHIPREILQQFPKFNELRINRYKIEVLRDDLFPVEFKRLEYLDLSENRIKTL